MTVINDYGSLLNDIETEVACEARIKSWFTEKKLLNDINGYGLVLMVINGYGWLLTFINVYGWLLCVINGYGWLLCVINCYRWLFSKTDSNKWHGFLLSGMAVLQSP